MATFKHINAEYNPKLTPEDNVKLLFNEYNGFVQNVTQTINNLDDENLSAELLNAISKEG